MRYVYKEGPVQLRNEEAYMVESDTGPAILNWAKVTSEVITKGIDAVNSDLGALQIKGNAWIRKSTIRGNSCICGNARFCDSRIQGDSWVGGEVHADSSCFKGTLCVCGNITARHTEFSGDISAAANVITFSNTCAGTIHVSNTLTYCYDWQILILKNGSHVDSVIFDSQRGRVICDKTSCCGEIVGGCHLSPHAGILASPREFQ